MCGTAGVLRVKPAWHRGLHPCHVPSAVPGGALQLLHEATAEERGVLTASGRAAVLPPCQGRRMYSLASSSPGPGVVTASCCPVAAWAGIFPCRPGNGTQTTPCGGSHHMSPSAKVAAGHPRLSQALGSLGTVPGPPGQCGGPWLALCLLLAYHRLPGLCVAKPLAFWLCRPPPLH